MLIISQLYFNYYREMYESFKFDHFKSGTNRDINLCLDMYVPNKLTIHDLENDMVIEAINIEHKRVEFSQKSRKIYKGQMRAKLNFEIIIRNMKNKIKELITTMRNEDCFYFRMAIVFMIAAMLCSNMKFCYTLDEIRKTLVKAENNKENRLLNLEDRGFISEQDVDVSELNSPIGTKGFGDSYPIIKIKRKHLGKNETSDDKNLNNTDKSNFLENSNNFSKATYCEINTIEKNLEINQNSDRCQTQFYENKSQNVHPSITLLPVFKYLLNQLGDDRETDIFLESNLFNTDGSNIRKNIEDTSFKPNILGSILSYSAQFLSNILDKRTELLEEEEEVEDNDDDKELKGKRLRKTGKRNTKPKLAENRNEENKSSNLIGTILSYTSKFLSNIIEEHEDNGKRNLEVDEKRYEIERKRRNKNLKNDIVLLKSQNEKLLEKIRLLEKETKAKTKCS